MSTPARNAANKALLVTVAAALALASGACSRGASEGELRVPLVAIAGPDDFSSFELRTSAGETLWRLQADEPVALPHLVYAIVPEGFRQILPTVGPPRPLRIGEDLILESRTTRRRFVHRGFASTDATMAISSSEMRRHGQAVASPEVEETG